jgi:hypothetical protein
MGPGQVVSVNQYWIRVSIVESKAAAAVEFDAKPVLGLPVMPGEGDEVLLNISHDGTAYITGVLAAAKSNQEIAGDDVFKISAGAWGKLSSENGKTQLQVFSPRNELIFEYVPEEEKTRVLVESGDLEISTTNGDICLNAGGDIKLDGNAVELRGQRHVALQVCDALNYARSWLTMGESKIRVHSSALDLRTRTAEMSVDRATYEGKQFSARVTRVKLALERIETVVTTLVQKARNVYHNVEQLSQLKAGRMRTLVQGSCYHKSEKAKFKANDSFSIDGDRINLG